MGKGLYLPRGIFDDQFGHLLKLLPWCFFTGVPLCHMDDALVDAKQQSETTPATADATKPKKPSAPGLSSSPTCSTETPPSTIPLLPDLPFF